MVNGERCVACGQLLPVARDTLYGRIAEDVRERIRRGYLEPGDTLPAEHTMAERWSVSRITVRTAMAALEREGLIVVVPGRGRYVAPDARDKVHGG